MASMTSGHFACCCNSDIFFVIDVPSRQGGCLQALPLFVACTLIRLFLEHTIEFTEQIGRRNTMKSTQRENVRARGHEALPWDLDS